jgi:hypothetical protein
MAIGFKFTYRWKRRAEARPRRICGPRRSFITGEKSPQIRRHDPRIGGRRDIHTHRWGIGRIAERWRGGEKGEDEQRAAKGATPSSIDGEGLARATMELAGAPCTWVCGSSQGRLEARPWGEAPPGRQEEEQGHWVPSAMDGQKERRSCVQDIWPGIRNNRYGWPRNPAVAGVVDAARDSSARGEEVAFRWGRRPSAVRGIAPQVPAAK